MKDRTGYGWLAYCFFHAGFWIRVFGYGPFIRRDREVYFSERYGYRKVWRIGRWSFEWLKPSKSAVG